MRWILVAALIALSPAALHAQSTKEGSGFYTPHEYGPPKDGYSESPPPPEKLTEAEIDALPHDDRRTKYIEGFSCSLFIYGQVGFLRLEPGGAGYVGHQEDSVKFAWWVRDDKYCTQYPGQVDPDCSDLPQRRLPNEREVFERWMYKGCI